MFWRLRSQALSWRGSRPLPLARAGEAAGAAQVDGREARPNRLPGSGARADSRLHGSPAGGRGPLRALTSQDELDDPTARLEGEAHPSRWARKGEDG